ncbi:MAG: NIPSNAP family protein, partial [Rhizobiales bacterium]|nr:NIPSNAP family protein [Hyphomicrobiales bacterium]
MAYDVTIISVRPGTQARALPKIQAALESGPGKLLACWTTDIGVLNQIMVIREFDSANAAADARKAMVMGDNLGVNEFGVSITSDTYEALPFLPALKPGSFGPFFEVRTYLLKPGVVSGNTERWEKAIPERIKRSPVLIG